VDDGMVVRVPGAGDAPISGKGPAGDLHVRVNVSPSKVFRRQGSNLYHDAVIPLHTALLGGQIRVPTLDADVGVKVLPGTQQGQEFVLKGRGVPSIYGNDKGDLFVAFSVQLPRSLTERQRAILQEYADDVEGRPSSRAKAKGESSSSSPSASQPAAPGEQPSSSGKYFPPLSAIASPYPAGSGDWLSSAWHRVKELIGHRS